ncbi:MAG: M28 family metallopeptidase, partial [Gemmatimonadaceae bacterium]|nr:M28 family metallopeptidase [Gemmatimonadaceae bacterium]
MARHRRLRGWIEPVQYWTVSAAVVVWVMVLIAWRERPPAPKPATVAPTEFSAARAWPVLTMLADSIRDRVAGTPGADSAAAYLERTLRAIPGIEVAQQDVSGAWSVPGYGTVAYTVRNVLARIPGRSRDAVLLSAHYDTPAGSVGAADDGVAVASLVEVVRALAAGPTLAHTVIVNFNDGEEQGLVGAHGFTRHPWIHDVRAFVNLESAGTSGKAILFQTGPGNAWLTDAYARAVPYPYGTVIAQDIFQSGAIPSDTDFRIYRDFAALPGLDIALYRGGWAYHTQRDRTWNISPGSMQQMGANALALARTLANGPLPGNVSRVRAVYYDLLGTVMVHYTERTAVVLAGLALVLGLAVLVLAVRRERVGVRELGLGLVFAVATVVAMLAGALLVGWVVAYPL